VRSEGGFSGLQPLKSGGKEGASYAEQEKLLAAITHGLDPSASVNRKGREARPPHFFFASESIPIHRSMYQFQTVT
jgi:hypothetical protein